MPPTNPHAGHATELSSLPAAIIETTSRALIKAWPHDGHALHAAAPPAWCGEWCGKHASRGGGGGGGGHSSPLCGGGGGDGRFEYCHDDGARCSDRRGGGGDAGGAQHSQSCPHDPRGPCSEPQSLWRWWRSGGGVRSPHECGRRPGGASLGVPSSPFSGGGWLAGSACGGGGGGGQGPPGLLAWYGDGDGGRARSALRSRRGLPPRRARSVPQKAASIRSSSRARCRAAISSRRASSSACRVRRRASYSASTAAWQATLFWRRSNSAVLEV